MAQFTVLVSGGGPAGLAAACLLAQAGTKTALVALPPAADDPRTIALMQPAIRLLDHIGVWRELAGQCAPLRQLHIKDDTGRYVTAPDLLFRADEVGLPQFGFNVPLSLLMPRLWQRVAELGVTVVQGHSSTATREPGAIRLQTDQGEALAGKALLIADGAGSALRDALGFHVTTTAYDQMALATSFSHSAPHGFTSTEWHKEGGPFTTVPMPGNRSSLVWMGKPGFVSQLNSLDDGELAREIQLASHGSLGRICDIGARRAFAMRTQEASPLAKSGAYLIGETGHTMPPIGAQGLNLSLRDAALAAELIAGADDPGNDALCARFDRERRSDVSLRLAATGFMNRSLLSSLEPMHLARVAGLSAVGQVPWLRHLALEAGLKPAGKLPAAML